MPPLIASSNSIILERENQMSSRERMEEEELSAEEEEEIEFAFSIDSEPGSLPADEIFDNGRIRSVYPLFNRRLIIGDIGDSKEEESFTYEKLDMQSRSESSSALSTSDTKDLDRLSKSAPTNFTSADRWRKSGSTGSTSIKWKLRDLVVGRSRSDGKERFLVVGPPPIEKAKEKKEKERRKEKKGEKSKEMDIVTAHRIYYGKVGPGGGQAVGATRRSFLPYRQELLGGIFGNAKHHPF